MTTSSTFDHYMERITAGERLTPDDIRDLAASPDILSIGMLADSVRRQLHGTRVTYLRVATCGFDKSFADAVTPAAREIRITGAPDTLSIAVSAVRSAKAIAGARTVAGFSWGDVERIAGDTRGGAAQALRELREAGLDALAELPLDATAEPAQALERLETAGFERVRLTVEKGAASNRTALLLKAADLQARFASIQAINPLPLSLNAFRPTTGYEDVRMVAIARLAAPGIPSVQVDWLRYGPKLAQVALTFGADDLYGVSSSDDAPEGRRRAPVEEIRRNIEAAGFVPAERDGAFAVLS
jgi:aminodeoxyfutalosine synthase